MSVALMSVAFKAPLPATQKLVLLALCDSANDQGECYPSVPTLMEKSSLSERAVQGAITAMESRGFLRREFRKGRSTVYWMTPAAGAPPQQVPPARSAPAPAPHAPPPPQQVHPTPAAGAPITIKEPSVEPSPKRKAGDQVAVSELVADGLDPETAAEWLDHRRRKRAMLTPRAWRDIKTEAAKAGWPIEAAVCKAMGRGWTGLEASWLAKEIQPVKAERFAGAI